MEKESDWMEILKKFDWDSKYGPFIGITRLQRWKRASKLGLNPKPNEILMKGNSKGKILILRHSIL